MMTTHNCGGRKKNKNYKNNKKKSGVRVGGGIDDVLDGDSEEARHSKSLYIAALYIFHMSGKLIYMIRRKKNQQSTASTSLASVCCSTAHQCMCTAAGKRRRKRRRREKQRRRRRKKKRKG